MRIQHNIMAMNAYRNYNNNTSALSKNLEKLSSGYRINRAGDDAAGLAISEKMRAQITALGAAQKNVKDGISLVKTAEGATQEIHDMLNRMVSLAEQSANGTYQDEVDREAITDEFNALKTEINRIADASNFNGIKLLDGKLGMNAAAFSMETVEGSAAKTLDGMIETGMPDAGDVKGTNTILHKDGVEGKLGEFTVDLSQLKADPTANNKTASVKVTIQGVDFTAAAAAQNTSLNGTEIAAKVAGQADGTTKYLIVSGGTAKLDTAANVAKGDLVYKATDNGDGTVTFKAHGYGAAASAVTAFDADKIDKQLADVADANFKHIGTTVTAAATTAGDITLTGAENLAVTNPVDSVKPGATVFGNTSLTIKAGDVKEGMSITIAGETHTFGDDDIKISDLKLNTDDGKKELTERIAQAFKDNKHVSVGADTGTLGKLTLAEKTDGQGKSLASKEMQKKMSTLDGFKSMVSFGEAAKSVGTSITVTSSKIKEGDTLNIDGKTYVFADKASTAIPEGATKVAIAGNAAQNLKDAIGNSAEISGNIVTVRAKNIDAAAAPQVLGKGLTLQIGDTSEDFNQLSVAIADMHTDALGLTDDINLGNQTDAAKAVGVIKNAINMVSTTRGRLGATQNRLEHTANNLSTMKENIQDAEATIRDTDIAEEMMAYTKNNILVQSAQAMLAQANQIPQGVLQLLG